MNEYPTPYQKRLLWRALTGISFTILGALAILAIWLLGEVLGYLQPVLIPLAVAGVIAYLLDPIVQWLQGRGSTRMKGIITVFVGFTVFPAPITF